MGAYSLESPCLHFSSQCWYFLPAFVASLFLFHLYRGTWTCHLPLSVHFPVCFRLSEPELNSERVRPWSRAVLTLPKQAAGSICKSACLWLTIAVRHQNKLSRSCRWQLSQASTNHTRTRWLISPWLSGTTRLPFPPLPNMCWLFPPDVIFITCERRAESNNSSTWKLTAGCTQTKWLPEDGLIWHHLFCVDGICSNPLPAALPRHCATAGKQGGLISGGLSQPGCQEKKRLLSENRSGFVHTYYWGKPPIAVLCSLQLIWLIK